MTDHIFDFIGGNKGEWEIKKILTVIGEPILPASCLQIAKGDLLKSDVGIWSLKGLVSNIHYTEKKEEEQLTAIQAGLGRPESTCAALIPIKKNEAWWNLAQDERRKIFEKKSNHIKTGVHYLPAIARKLFHCRDIGEPFDFLTWFEYAPEHAAAFEELVAGLRTTPEWDYVEREIDIRLVKK